MVLQAVDHFENNSRCQNLNLGSTSSQTATWIFYIHIWLGAWCVCIYVISALHLLTGVVPEWKKKCLMDCLTYYICCYDGCGLQNCECKTDSFILFCGLLLLLWHIILLLLWIYTPSHSKWSKMLFFSTVSMLIIFQNTCCNTRPVLCVLVGTMRM